MSSNLTASAISCSCAVKPVAVIQHVANDGPSYFATWLDRQGLAFRVFRMFEGDRLPDDLQGCAGLCILGGPMSANDPLPYFEDLFKLVRGAVKQGIPVIGHCLGGQIMSRALGGTVQASPHAEIGWSDLEACHGPAAQWVLPNVSLRLFQWHAESFSIPPGAIPILRGRHCMNQAYVLNDMHLGMQFHCEVDEAKVRTWLTEGEEEIRQSDSPGVGDIGAILRTLKEDLLVSQRLADRLYERWANGLRP